ncbi:hypothetical protein Bpfe_013841 [Biomphalaria pfeifferi]|uniref:Uncharacterized protein n=1 Tax=Biomphalaria pfeifferi TaxID=112525 RepID=A0AAD8BL61_BIOPF|nr:hypothetical protein Bpfe_013841 [Biomphalaria pfeifferi]
MSSAKEIITPILSSAKEIITPICLVPKKLSRQYCSSAKEIITPILSSAKEIITPIVSSGKEMWTKKDFFAPPARVLRFQASKAWDIANRSLCHLVECDSHVMTSLQIGP